MLVEHGARPRLVEGSQRRDEVAMLDADPLDPARIHRQCPHRDPLLPRPQRLVKFRQHLVAERLHHAEMELAVEFDTGEMVTAGNRVEPVEHRLHRVGQHDPFAADAGDRIALDHAAGLVEIGQFLRRDLPHQRPPARQQVDEALRLEPVESLADRRPRHAHDRGDRLLLDEGAPGIDAAQDLLADMRIDPLASRPAFRILRLGRRHHIQGRASSSGMSMRQL